MPGKIKIVDRPLTRSHQRRPELVAAVLATVTTGKAIEIDPRSHNFADPQSVRHSLQVTVNRKGLAFHCVKSGKDGLLFLWATKKGQP